MPAPPTADPTLALDRAGFDALLRRHHRPLLAYARALARDEAAAEDLLQESLVVAYRRLADFTPTLPFAPWVRGIVRRKYLESARRRREQPLTAPELDALDRTHRGWDPSGSDDPFDPIESLRDCVRALPPDFAELIRLAYEERWPGKRMARHLGTPEPALRKRLQRIRERLAECIRRKKSATGEPA